MVPQSENRIRACNFHVLRESDEGTKNIANGCTTSN
jgi:hypothetical protein